MATVWYNQVKHNVIKGKDGGVLQFCTVKELKQFAIVIVPGI